MDEFDYQIYTTLYPKCFNLNYIDAYIHYKNNKLPNKLDDTDLQKT